MERETEQDRVLDAEVAEEFRDQGTQLFKKLFLDMLENPKSHREELGIEGYDSLIDHYKHFYPEVFSGFTTAQP